MHKRRAWSTGQPMRIFALVMPEFSIFEPRFIDLLAGFNQNFIGEGVEDVFDGVPAQDTLAQTLNDFAALHQRFDFHTHHRCRNRFP
jgi:predicted glycosyltransferase involved in capsule biosynthesis